MSLLFWQLAKLKMTKIECNIFLTISLFLTLVVKPLIPVSFPEDG